MLNRQKEKFNALIVFQQFKIQQTKSNCTPQRNFTFKNCRKKLVLHYILLSKIMQYKHEGFLKYVKNNDILLV